MKNVFDYIVAQNFFRDYCPEVKSHKFKMRGTNSRGNPVEFSDQDRAEIKRGLKKLFKDLDKEL